MLKLLLNSILPKSWDLIGFDLNFCFCSLSFFWHKDNELPQFSPCPSDISVNTESGAPNATVSWGMVNITDNDGLNSSSFSHMDGDVFPIGTMLVTISATDNSGNSATCEFNVTVTGMTGVWSYWQFLLFKCSVNVISAVCLYWSYHYILHWGKMGYMYLLLSNVLH